MNEVCEDGSCGNECSGNNVECDGSCVNLQTDVEHCGECDYACSVDQICAGGACQGA
jgi:hypothetical protein